MYEKSREKEEIYVDEPFCCAAQSQPKCDTLKCDGSDQKQRQKIPSRLLAAREIASQVRLVRENESRVL